jgi:hypothetical protein
MIPYEPMARLHSRRRPVSKVDTVEWQRCIGFTPDHVVDKTLLVTTQLVPTVEADTELQKWWKCYQNSLCLIHLPYAIHIRMTPSHTAFHGVFMVSAINGEWYQWNIRGQNFHSMFHSLVAERYSVFGLLSGHISHVMIPLLDTQYHCTSPRQSYKTDTTIVVFP